MLFLALALAGAAAGCGSDPDPGAGGGVASGDPEGGTDDDGGPPNPGPDGGTDAPADAPFEARPSYCSKLVVQPKFCDDFDDANLTNNWDQATTTAGSGIGFDLTTSTSAPASFRALAAATPAMGLSIASLRSTVTGTPTHVSLAFSAHMPITTLTDGAIAIADLDVSDNHVFTLYLRDEDDMGQKPSLKEIDGSTITYYPLPKVPAANTWTRITLDIDAAGGKATVSFDSEKVLDAIAVSAGATKDPTFRVGAVYDVGPTNAFVINIDDVVVDF